MVPKLDTDRILPTKKKTTCGQLLFNTTGLRGCVQGPGQLTLNISPTPTLTRAKAW